MPEIYLPHVSHKSTAAENAAPPSGPLPSGGAQRIVLDPLTRMEGRLRIDATLDDGRITQAWSAATLLRGLEKVLVGRDPRDAWLFAQRVCGVCTSVHALASVRAVENALGLVIPDNARLIRNLIAASQYVQDHVIHFYHLHALDWVDLLSALQANPAHTSALAASLAHWPAARTDYFAAVQARLQSFATSGQLGWFANGYWGHPAYQLPPEANLLAISHYLEALDWQHSFIQMHALLGGKNPHPQTFLVGGMAIPLNPASAKGLNTERLASLRELVNQARLFVEQVYLPDLKLVAAHYPEYFRLGAGPERYLSYGEFPESAGTPPEVGWLPSGYYSAGALQPLDTNQIAEFVTHSWYAHPDGAQAGLHPAAGETAPHYTGPQPPYERLDTEAAYSWLKAPRYAGESVEVGPLARLRVAYAAGQPQVVAALDGLLAELNLDLAALNSTLGRILARGVETVLVAERMGRWIDHLESNMQSGDTGVHCGQLWDPEDWPSKAEGWGAAEAPRGALGHWLRIENQHIAHYQMVMPTTWNGSPRDHTGAPGPFEQSLAGLPVVDAERPLEILRTIHSFDSCMACAVHLITADDDTGTGITVTSAHGGALC